MNDVVTELHAALVAATAAGEPLEDFLNRVHADVQDFNPDHRAPFPMIVLAVPPGAVYSDVLRGSRWVIGNGTVGLELAVRVSEKTSDRWDAARRSCDAYVAALERVLLSLRTLTSDAHPTGVWTRMSFVQEAAGPADIGGISCYATIFRLTFRFRRYRSAA